MTIDFICKSGNLWIVVKSFSSGHRAAYVGVPYGHRLYGRDDDWPEVKAFTTLFGKVNYADHRVGGWEGHPREQETWWYGVDNFYKDDPQDSLFVAYTAGLQLADQIRNGAIADRPVKDLGWLKNATIRNRKRRKRVG